MRKTFQGWLGGRYDDLSMHDSKESAERGFGGIITLDEALEDFQEKKIRITVEVIEE